MPKQWSKRNETAFLVALLALAGAFQLIIIAGMALGIPWLFERPFLLGLATGVFLLGMLWLSRADGEEEIREREERERNVKSERATYLGMLSRHSGDERAAMKAYLYETGGLGDPLVEAGLVSQRDLGAAVRSLAGALASLENEERKKKEKEAKRKGKQGNKTGKWWDEQRRKDRERYQKLLDASAGDDTAARGRFVRDYGERRLRRALERGI